LVSEFQADDKPPLLSFKPVYQIDAGDNQGGGLQKNWCFFEQDENLMCVYRSRPEQTIFRVQGAKVTNEHRSPDPRWPYGELRGGVILPWGDKLLRFFHSSIDAGAQRRYFIGACLMNATPPYEVSAIGSRPILYGSEIDDLRVKDRPFHWKANVVIPGGAIEDKDGWLLAVGVNDSACAVVRVTEKDLRL
jgi:hypothetical protein